MARNSNSPSAGLRCQSALIIVLALGMLGSCKNNEPKFGLDANENRRKVGLEVLSKNWKVISKGKDYTIWKNPLADKLLKEQKPVFFSKSIRYNEQNELVSEEDLYYSGKKVATIDGHESEAVSIKYYYQPQELADTIVNGWFCTYIGNEFESRGNKEAEDLKLDLLIPNHIELIAADSILKKWGFKLPVRE